MAARLEVLLGHKTYVHLAGLHLTYSRYFISQNLRHRALLALRALSAPDPDAEDPNDSESYLAQHAPTIIRRLTRAAREDRVRSDEIGAVGALLLGAKDLLRVSLPSDFTVLAPLDSLDRILRLAEAYVSF